MNSRLFSIIRKEFIQILRDPRTLAMILLIIMFWDTHRLLSLGVVAGIFLACGMLAWVVAVRKARSKPRLFAASLSELSKDRQELISRS